MMKSVVVILIVAFIALSAEAAPSQADEIEFSLKPSFHDGLFV